MSRKTTGTRSRRSDAKANAVKIHAATLALLGNGGDPSMAEIANAAGLSRQALYDHYPNRKALYDTLVAHLVAEMAAVLDDELPEDPVAGLEEWLTRAWDVLDRYPALLNPALFAGITETDVVVEHEPITGSLRDVLADAAARGLLAQETSPDWLVAAVIALGHAAGKEVAAGRMSTTTAGAAFRASALRLCIARTD